MGAYIDLTGQKFGKLTVIKRVYNYQCGKNYTGALFLCKCDCGNETIVAGRYLRDGKQKSCGCYRREWQRERKKKSGE